jgi:hypothetical protein
MFINHMDGLVVSHLASMQLKNGYIESNLYKCNVIEVLIK